MTCTRAAARKLFPAALVALVMPLLTLGVNASSCCAAELPNVVLVMADDQGWGDMAYNGHDLLKTPNFDQAAAEGLRFDRFYAAAPVCSPTRASVMTGRHPNRMGVFKWGYPMRPQEITIAEALKTAGYTTAHFGKWHLGSVRNESPAHPGRNGFDHWLSAPNFYDNDPVMSLMGKATPIEGESSVIAAEAAIEWMGQQAAGDAPFLAVVWFGSPHSPHRAVEQDRKLYEDQPAKLQNFYGEITGMDRAFGMLRDALTDLKVRDDTILWYTSDNGALPGVGSTGGHRGNKGSVYEGGLLVPAIIEWPAKITQPRVTDVRCNSSDIYPTLLEIAGVTMKNQPQLDGASLKGLITSGEVSRDKPMGFWDYSTRGISTPSARWMADLLKAQQNGGDLPPHPSSQNAAKLPSPAYPTDSFPGHAAWIAGDWKLHRKQAGGGKVSWELYDLAADPAEKQDMLSTEGDRADAMRPQLESWLVSVVNSLNGEDYGN